MTQRVSAKTTRQAKKIAIIVNQRAGFGTASSYTLQAKRVLWGWEQEFFFPESVDEARNIIDRLDPSIFFAIVVMGGDGTFNKMLPALMKSAIPSLPFPCGTANDFARELKIAADWATVQSLFDTQAASKVDVITANGVPFVTVARIGVGALLTQEFNQKREKSKVFAALSRRLRSELYSLLSLKTILMTRKYNQELHVRSDQFSEKLSASAVFVCNQDSLGGDITVAPRTTRNDDERFNVLIVPKKNPIELVNCLVNLKNRVLTSELISFSTTRLQLESSSHKKISIFGDGEILTESSSVEFQILPGALTVFRKPA